MSAVDTARTGRLSAHSLTTHSERYLPWLSLPATAPCKSVLLPSSAVLPNFSRLSFSASLILELTCRSNSVMHSPGFTQLMTTLVCDTGLSEASSRKAYNETSLEIGYLNCVHRMSCRKQDLAAAYLLSIPKLLLFRPLRMSPLTFSSSPFARNATLLPMIVK